MKTNNQRRQYISTHQIDRAAMIITAQWEEVISIVQERADIRHQERRILIHQAIQSSELQRRIA
jgi:hypothetical protein